jgi:DNA-binding transcriptional LysR family regulator
LWQPPVLHGDVRAAGNETTSPRYFAPLLAELRARAPVGRVEVVATSDYWESAYVAREVHLARGWLRQADIARSPLFYDGTLDASSYERWLRDNGVAYVALPDARLSWVGRREAALVRAGLPYLTQVWRGEDWTLYEVAGRPSIVDGGTLVSTDASSVTVDAPAGSIVVKIRYSGWLRVNGLRNARLEPGPGGWTRLVATVPGRYRIDS